MAAEAGRRTGYPNAEPGVDRSRPSEMIMWVNPNPGSLLPHVQLPLCWIVEDPGTLGHSDGPDCCPRKNSSGGPLRFQKLAHHQHGAGGDRMPESVNRAVNPGTEEDLMSDARKCISRRRWVPSSASAEPVVCNKGQFKGTLLSITPGSGQTVTIATGFSGHGLEEFVAVVGEILRRSLADEGEDRGYDRVSGTTEIK